jgi:hypothetical protein
VNSRDANRRKTSFFMRRFYHIKDNPSRGNAMKTGEKPATANTGDWPG